MKNTIHKVWKYVKYLKSDQQYIKFQISILVDFNLQNYCLKPIIVNQILETKRIKQISPEESVVYPDNCNVPQEALQSYNCNVLEEGLQSYNCNVLEEAI